MREKLKSTIGGSEYVVSGEIINVEGNNYTLKTSGGETFQLEATDDTNMFCKSNSNSSQTRRTSASGQGQQAQSQQSESNIGVSEKQAQS